MMNAGRTDVRSFEAGMLLTGVGAILLIVSLFLEWFQPGIDAWEIFEVWDLVLAALAIAALVGVASRLGFGPPRPAGWVTGPAIAALVIVLYAIIDPPPLTASVNSDPGTGLWLALAATVLMTVGAAMSFARVSIAFTRAPGVGDPGAYPRPGVVDPAAADPAAPYAGAPVADPIAADPAVAPGVAPRASRRFMRSPSDPATPASPPTEPTRRL